MSKHRITFAAMCACLGASAISADAPAFRETFAVEKNDLSSTGKSEYFVLEPGFIAVFEGKEDGKKTVLTVTVTDRTKTVDGVETRVIEEREKQDGVTVETSLNYFAISKTSGDVYYFGEDTDTIKGEKWLTGQAAGSWLAGVAGARFGLAMPGKPKVGDAYFQELAPKIAMDRAEIVSVSETLKTPAGEFMNCVKTKETTPLEKGTEFKLYAPGVGLVKDGNLLLVKYGSGGK